MYATYHSYTQNISWTWDTGILEAVSVSPYLTNATFRAKKATTLSGSVVQAVTYYMKSGTTSSGMNKDVDTWYVYVTDNSKVSLNYSQSSVYPGDSFWLVATPSNSTYTGTYQWTTSDSNVAYVNVDGNTAKVVTKNSGTCYITVKLSNGNFARCLVTVNSIPVKTANVTVSKNFIEIDESLTAKLSTDPTNAIVNSRNWYSSNSSVATVSSSGVIVGKSSGSTEIYCVVNNNVTSNRCKITVASPKLSVTSTIPSNNAKEQSVLIQPSVTFCRTISKGTTFNDILLKKSDGSTVQGNCSINGSVVTFTPSNHLQANTLYTFYIPSNAVKDKYESYNESYEFNFTTSGLENISLESKYTVYLGYTYQIIPILTPNKASAVCHWTSSDNNVATVNDNGEVTPKKIGKTTIYVETENGMKASTNIEIKDVPETLKSNIINTRMILLKELVNESLK